MNNEQIRAKQKEDIANHFKVMDSVLATLMKLSHDNRLTREEQQDLSIAWGHLYYTNAYEKKLTKLNESDTMLPN